jgi:hypothetical protein
MVENFDGIILVVESYEPVLEVLFDCDNTEPYIINLIKLIMRKLIL